MDKIRVPTTLPPKKRHCSYVDTLHLTTASSIANVSFDRLTGFKVQTTFGAPLQTRFCKFVSCFITKKFSYRTVCATPNADRTARSARRIHTRHTGARSHTNVRVLFALQKNFL
jgi:hypothetical protein